MACKRRELFAEYRNFIVDHKRRFLARERGINVGQEVADRVHSPISVTDYEAANNTDLEPKLKPRNNLCNRRYHFEVYGLNDGFDLLAPANGEIKLEIPPPETLDIKDQKGHDTDIVVLDLGNGLEAIITHAKVTGEKEVEEGKPFGIQKGTPKDVQPHAHYMFAKRDENGVLRPYEVAIKASVYEDKVIYPDYEKFLIIADFLEENQGAGVNYEEAVAGRLRGVGHPISRAQFDRANNSVLPDWLKPKKLLTGHHFVARVFGRPGENFDLLAPANGEIKLEIPAPLKLTLPPRHRKHNSDIAILDLGNGLEVVAIHARVKGDRSLTKGRVWGEQANHGEGTAPHTHLFFGKWDNLGRLNPYEVAFESF